MPVTAKDIAAGPLGNSWHIIEATEAGELIFTPAEGLFERMQISRRADTVSTETLKAMRSLFLKGLMTKPG